MYSAKLLPPPPTREALETLRRQRQRMMLMHGLVVAGVAIFIGTSPGSLMTARLVDFAALFLFVAILAYSAITFVRHFAALCLDEECGVETLEALLCSDIPQVMRYCEAVKREGRLLTVPEAKRLLAVCKADPVAFMKVAASYEKFDMKYKHHFLH